MEGGKEEGKGEEGEEDEIQVRRRRLDLGRYSLGRVCERQRLHRRRRWLHQAEGTPARRKGEEEAPRATATRFFFDGRMRGRGASFVWLFICFFCLGVESGEKEKGGRR
jgi:hypothetical protein